MGIPGIFGSGMAGSKGTIMHVEWVMPVADPICLMDSGVAGKNEKNASWRRTSAQFSFRMGIFRDQTGFHNFSLVSTWW